MWDNYHIRVDKFGEIRWERRADDVDVYDFYDLVDDADWDRGFRFSIWR
jgi:hypothetical protein